VDADVRRVLPAGDEDARSDPPSKPGAER
jgi:hypothetical protein